jgi:hypothetical protein
MANTGFLVFNTAGVLVSAGFGNNCSAGSCTIVPGQEQWLVAGPLFQYSTTGATSTFTGTASLTLSQTVPEPSTLPLFGIGLGILTLAGIRQRHGTQGSYCTASAAWYELRTSGPLSTWRKPNS